MLFFGCFFVFVFGRVVGGVVSCWFFVFVFGRVGGGVVFCWCLYLFLGEWVVVLFVVFG